MRPLYQDVCASPESEVILALLEQRGDIDKFVDDINDWAEEQSPPLFTLQYGRWTRWLEQAQDAFEQREREVIYELMEKRAAKSKKEL